MKLQILPPEKAKKRAQAKMKAWKQKKEIDEKMQKKLNQELVFAIECRDPIKVKDLLDKGADPNTKVGTLTTVTYLAFGDYCKQRSFAIMLESASENIYKKPLQILKLLAEHGAEIDDTIRAGLTQMMYSDDYGNDVIREILRKNETE